MATVRRSAGATPMKVTLVVECHSDDIILVVSVTGWCCKSCNIKQDFVGGESIEKHLQQNHQIGAKSGNQQYEKEVNENVQGRRGMNGPIPGRRSHRSADLHKTSAQIDEQLQAKPKSRQEAQNQTPPQTRTRSADELQSTLESSRTVLGPRQRKRTAKVLESELQREIQSKRMKRGSKIRSSDMVDVSPHPSLENETPSSSSSMPAKLPSRTAVGRKAETESEKPKTSSKFVTTAKLKEKYRRSAKSAACITSVSDLNNIYVTELSSTSLEKEVDMNGSDSCGARGTANINIQTPSAEPQNVELTGAERAAVTPGGGNITDDVSCPVKADLEKTFNMDTPSSDATSISPILDGQNSSLSHDAQGSTFTTERLGVPTTPARVTVALTGPVSVTAEQGTQSLRSILISAPTAASQAGSDTTLSFNSSYTAGTLPSSQTTLSQAIDSKISLMTALAASGVQSPGVLQHSSNPAVLYEGSSLPQDSSYSVVIIPQTGGSGISTVIVSDTHSSIAAPFEISPEFVPVGSYNMAAVSAPNCTSLTSVVSSGITTSAQIAAKPSMSSVAQDDSQALELVTGALQELQDSLLAMPAPAVSTTQEVSEQQSNIHVSELVLTDSCPPMQQFEQHVARMVQKNETSDLSEVTSVQFSPQDHQYERPSWRQSHPSGDSSAVRIVCVTQDKLSEEKSVLEAVGSIQTPVIGAQQKAEYACPGPTLAESADHLTKKLCDIILDKTEISEADIEQILTPNKAPHVCEFCEHNFISAEALQEHVARYATQQPVQCKVCQLKLHSLDLLNVHIYYTHEAKGRFPFCLTCGKLVESKIKLLHHIVNQHATAQKHTPQSLLTDSRGMHECSVCKKRILDAQGNVDRHYKLHGDRQYKCLACGKKFLYKYLLLAHMEMQSSKDDIAHHTELLQMKASGINDDPEEGDHNPLERGRKPRTEEKYHCNLCDKDMWNIRQTIRRHLVVHARRHMMNTREKFHCPDCGKDIPNFDRNITTHLRTHGQVSFKCKHCDKTFSSFGNCRRHENQSHGNVKPQKSMCEICGKMMYSKYTLQKHVKLHGEVRSLFSCDQCPRSFHYHSQLEKHRAKHGPDSNRTILCQYCSKPYLHKKSLERHIQVEHLGVKDYPYKCDQCSAQFFDSVQLRDHKAYKHQNIRRYKCSVCAESFVCRPTLRRHMRRDHEGYSPYICNVCGQKFVEKLQLVTHQAVHTGMEPFQCTVCSKSFTRPRSLRLHMNLHAGIRPYACEACGKAYGKKNHLERHQKKCRSMGSGFTQSADPVQSALQAMSTN